MMKKIYALVIFAAIFAVCLGVDAVFANEKHPIDAALEEKIDADPSTTGMIEASQWAAQEWDKLLNENYSALMEKLDKENQERLRASQREWIKFRDLEFEFNANFWAGFDGTMYRVFPYGFQADFIRERALALGSYLNADEW